MSELDLIDRAQAGDSRAMDELIRRYSERATILARAFFHPSLEHDDLHQEALIALMKAVRDFDTSLGVPFGSFADLCIRRSLITALKTAQRVKHEMLTNARRVSPLQDGDDGGHVEAILLAVARGSVSDHIEWREDVDELARKLRVELSPMELRCLLRFANGMTYEEIAAEAGIDDVKAVDRAITRARWKLRGEGPPSKPDLATGRKRKAYRCPGCGLATVKKTRGRGRPPRCNVCLFRAQAA